ncbi:hypothetical protein FGG08_003337 [Glutinoglossum americanum]|uniref:L-serine ammonia-lyase n=1 Tax=Glutinoglossum americanum TaxID=1670608 RepID=A0A9P8IB63_9PEZI|nr:hypothetical protein FGG08_003337 [Glutinoglossum americanum]
MLARLHDHPSTSPPHFYASSGGNAGLACATAARSLGLPSTIAVPQSTSPLMIRKIRTAGSAVVQTGCTWKEADTYLRTELLTRDEGGIYVPPFDHADIWAGNATVLSEIIEQMEDLGAGVPDVLTCSVGGGGLLNGLVHGLSAVDPACRPTILAVETRGADSMHQSLVAESLITLPGITSLATSLGATQVSEQTFRYAMDPEKKIVSRVLSDEEAVRGCVELADRERVIVEAACGVCVAAVCEEGRRGEGWVKGEGTTVVIVVCGGSNCSVEMLAEWRREFGGLEKGEVVAGEKAADVVSGLQTPPEEKV